MKYLRRELKTRIFKKWEINLMLTLVVLLVMATFLDLGISFKQIIFF